MNDFPTSPRDSGVLVRALVERLAALFRPISDPCPVPETGWTALQWAEAGGLGCPPHVTIRQIHPAALPLGAHDPQVIADLACQTLARAGRLEWAAPGLPARYRPGRGR